MYELQRRVDALGFAWWNTGMSPNTAKGRATPQETGTAAEMLVLLGQLGLHFIALGEVAISDIAAIKKLVNTSLDDYVFLDATNAAGRSQFDTCIAYRADAVSIASDSDLVLKSGRRTTRIGQYFQLAVRDEPKPFHVFVSHWPSRLSLHEDSPKRIELGMRLRDKVNDIFEVEQDAHVILLGDYNDEPFDTSISESLQATRDRRFVLKRPHLLYNPFWRHLSSYEHADSEEKLSDPGTYFHGNGELTRWRTFDHMMFSSSLLAEGSGWRLNERETRVVNIPAYTEMVQARKHVFDHLPIMSRISRSTTNGRL